MIKHRENCRGCLGDEVIEFLDLGAMPLAGGFLKEDQISEEVKIPLKVYFCKECGLVQILDVVDPEVLFKDYCYVSSVIQSLAEHFKNYADQLKETYLCEPGSGILEFGCNDGVLLQNFMNDKDIRSVGVDPSLNVSAMARERGLEVVTGYFNQENARRLKGKYGEMQVVTGSNVFAHVDDIHEIIDATQIILSDDGVFIVEVHYLGDLIGEFQYDTIYHEHLTYYSVSALRNIYGRHGLNIIDVQHLPMHGGAIRVVAAREGSKWEEKSVVAMWIKKEKEAGLLEVATYLDFKEKCERHREEFKKILAQLKSSGGKMAGYGAPGRGTILTNYLQITREQVDYIVDVSPLRIGKLMPGVHIPIIDREAMRMSPPDFFVVLAWNYIDSILEQEADLRRQGVKFLVPFPSIKIF